MALFNFSILTIILRFDRLIPDSSNPHFKVSLGKILKPKLLPMADLKMNALQQKKMLFTGSGLKLMR